MANRNKYGLFRIGDADRFRVEASSAAENMGGKLNWTNPAEDERMFYYDVSGDVHTVLMAFRGGVSSLFRLELAKRLTCPWIELRIQEGSIWDYSLYLGDELIDNFSVYPDYWVGAGGGDAAYYEARKGNPALLADVWGVPLERIERYLIQWEMRPNPGVEVLVINPPDPVPVPEETIAIAWPLGKAYPWDEYEYGDAYQAFDVLRALGGKHPPPCAAIDLPERPART